MNSDIGANAGLLSVSTDDSISSATDSAPELVSSVSKPEACQYFSDVTIAPSDLKKGPYLKPLFYVLDNGSVFHDKLLPQPSFKLIPDNLQFDKEYYVDLHLKVSSFNTYNHLGARIPLKHSSINISKFRALLPSDYDDKVILQYLEFGFPLGLKEDFLLKPILKNHSSAYEYYTYVDKFVSNELEKGGMCGPFHTSPFPNVMVSPLMTSPKKPNSRRTVFDASFSDYSLNVNTPDKVYLGEDYDFTFPKLDDFASLILKFGPGCFMWKRDLSRFFLQLPLDPLDFDKVGFVWRGQLLLFTSYVWGTRHAGMSGQRVTSAVS